MRATLNCSKSIPPEQKRRFRNSPFGLKFTAGCLRFVGFSLLSLIVQCRKVNKDVHSLPPFLPRYGGKPIKLGRCVGCQKPLENPKLQLQTKLNGAKQLSASSHTLACTAQPVNNSTEPARNFVNPPQSCRSLSARVSAREFHLKVHATEYLNCLRFGGFRGLGRFVSYVRGWVSAFVTRAPVVVQ